jgi:hypothetical protein
MKQEAENLRERRQPCRNSSTAQKKLEVVELRWYECVMKAKSATCRNGKNKSIKIFTNMCFCGKQQRETMFK